MGIDFESHKNSSVFFTFQMGLEQWHRAIARVNGREVS